MITGAYSVFDSKAGLFGTPFFSLHEPVALRSFKDLVNDPNSTVSRNPEDFSLFFVGQFDDDLGSLVAVKPKNLVTASSMKNQGFGFSQNGRDVTDEVNRIADGMRRGPVS